MNTTVMTDYEKDVAELLRSFCNETHFDKAKVEFEHTISSDNSTNYSVDIIVNYNKIKDDFIYNTYVYAKFVEYETKLLKLSKNFDYLYK